MAYDHELPPITKPGDVEDDEWEKVLANYFTALAMYRRAVEAIAEEIRQGRLPSEELVQTENRAQDILAIARGLLLDVSAPLQDATDRKK